MRFLKVKVFSILVGRVCKVKYDIVCDFASSQQLHQLHNFPVLVCFRSISLIFLAINSTVIAAVSSFGVNCSSRLKFYLNTSA